ncbi:MAG: ParB family chromosome partitioning protein [Candidatus Azotimanducaceae bacterium]|jgi:ParB family chromosome partitioning protein
MEDKRICSAIDIRAGKVMDVLQFPTALSERSGLALAQALGTDAGSSARLRKKLDATHTQTAGAEKAAIAAAIKGPAKDPVKTGKAPQRVKLPSGLEYVAQPDVKITLSGAVLKDDAYVNRLIQTLSSVS